MTKLATVFCCGVPMILTWHVPAELAVPQRLEHLEKRQEPECGIVVPGILLSARYPRTQGNSDSGIHYEVWVDLADGHSDPARKGLGLGWELTASAHARALPHSSPTLEKSLWIECAFYLKSNLHWSRNPLTLIQVPLKWPRVADTGAAGLLWCTDGTCRGSGGVRSGSSKENDLLHPICSVFHHACTVLLQGL